MARMPAWHAKDSDVYHVCSNCNTGNNIESENRRNGKGGNSLCSECAGLIDNRKC